MSQGVDHLVCLPKTAWPPTSPIEKNVIVVDEQGNEYEATYPKRAKGLVKNGRARFVDENKICLACPPDKILEEEKMEENKLTAKEIFVQLTILQKTTLAKKPINTKGATPIEKNVIVVDEQGNEYEATYPKRAKGLVKNGRARFVGENKICLACPPDKILEEEKMEENKLTAKEIFVQLTILQKQLTENSQTSLHRLGDALSTFESENVEASCEQISEICGVFKTRELTLLNMLGMYEKMYNDVQNEETKKVNLVKSAFDKITDVINAAEIESAEKYDALCTVTDKISEIVEKIVVNN